MNVSGEGRKNVAHNLRREEFLKYVATAIEKQLKEWDENYEVYVMKLKKYEIMINNGEHYYHVKLAENELDSLQKASPFELDRKVWKELIKQELPIKRGEGDEGNYIDMVL